VGPEIGGVISDADINMGVGAAKNVLNALSTEVQSIMD
jgi:hypothetical protein